MKAHATGYPLGYYQNYMQETLFESMRQAADFAVRRGDPVVPIWRRGAFHGRGTTSMSSTRLWENVVGQKPLTAVPHHAASQHRPAQLEDQGDGRSRAVHAGLCARRRGPGTVRPRPRAAAEESASLGKGYGWQPTIDVAALDETETAFFTLLTKRRTLLTGRMPRVAEDEKTCLPGHAFIPWSR